MQQGRRQRAKAAKWSILLSRQLSRFSFQLTSIPLLLIFIQMLPTQCQQLSPIAAIGENGTSTVEVTGICDNLDTNCEERGFSGDCDSDPAYMLVNCPRTCDSCLPETLAECVDKGDSENCFLGAALGLCETNPSYYLRRCAASCSEFLEVCTLHTRDFGGCGEDPRSLGNPDFECGLEAGNAGLRAGRLLSYLGSMDINVEGGRQTPFLGKMPTEKFNKVSERNAPQRSFPSKRNKRFRTKLSKRKANSNKRKNSDTSELQLRQEGMIKLYDKRRNMKKLKKRKEKSCERSSRHRRKCNKTQITRIYSNTKNLDLLRPTEALMASLKMILSDNSFKLSQEFSVGNELLGRQEVAEKAVTTVTEYLPPIINGTTQIIISTNTITLIGTEHTITSNYSTIDEFTKTKTVTESVEKTKTKCTRYTSRGGINEQRNFRFISDDQGHLDIQFLSLTRNALATSSSPEEIEIKATKLFTSSAAQQTLFSPTPVLISTGLTRDPLNLAEMQRGEIVLRGTMNEFWDLPSLPRITFTRKVQTKTITVKTDCQLPICEVSDKTSNCKIIPRNNGKCQLPCKSICSDATLTVSNDCFAILIRFDNLTRTELRDCPVLIFETKDVGNINILKLTIEYCKNVAKGECSTQTLAIESYENGERCPFANIVVGECENAQDDYCPKLIVDIPECENPESDKCPYLNFFVGSGSNQNILFTEKKCFRIKHENEVCNFFTGEEVECFDITSGNELCPNITNNFRRCAYLTSGKNNKVSLMSVTCPTNDTNVGDTDGDEETNVGDTDGVEETIATVGVLTATSALTSILLNPANVNLFQQILQQLFQNNNPNTNQNNQNNQNNNQQNQDNNQNNNQNNNQQNQDNNQQNQDNNQNNNQNNNQQNQDNNQNNNPNTPDSNQNTQNNIQNSNLNNNNQNTQGNNQASNPGIQNAQESQPAPQSPSLPASVALVPNCVSDGYLSLVEELQDLVGQNSGRPLPSEAFDVVGALNFCQHGGEGEVPSRAQSILMPETKLKPPSGWLGLSSPSTSASRNKRRTKGGQRNKHPNLGTLSFIPDKSQFKPPVIEYGGWIPIIPHPYSSSENKQMDPASHSLSKKNFQEDERFKRDSKRQNNLHRNPSKHVLVITDNFYKPPPVPRPHKVPTSQVHNITKSELSFVTKNLTEIAQEMETEGGSISPTDNTKETLDLMAPPAMAVDSDEPQKTKPSAAELQVITGSSTKNETEIGIVETDAENETHTQDETDEGKTDAENEDYNEDLEEDRDEPTEGEPSEEDESLLEETIFFCGGTLITQKHILTAAHCVIPRKPNVIRLGEIDFSESNESRAVDYRIQRIAVNPGYRFPVKYNDIAIITLVVDVPVTTGLVPSCIPAFQQNLIEGQVATVSGWGTRANREASEVLVEVEVQVRSMQQCNDSYSSLGALFTVHYPSGITSSMICAGGDQGEDVCRGDSGGPLYLREILQQEVAGVVSAGFGCGDINFPGLYTRVDTFLTWIDLAVYGRCASPIR